MKSMFLSVACVLLSPGALMAQALLPPGVGGPAGLEVIDFGRTGPDAVVQNAPFAAEAQTTMIQRLPDGNRIERRMVSRLARDSRGRTRREQPMPPLGPLGQAAPVILITIADPVAGVEYLLRPETNSAHRITMPSLNARPPRPLMPAGSPGGAPMPPETSTASLGTRTIAGVLAEGTRTTMRIPAGAFGNVKPIDVVTDRWVSPALGMVVASHRSDPVLGDTTFAVTSLDRAEPSADLFEVPTGYTIVQRLDAPRPPRPR